MSSIRDLKIAPKAGLI